MSKINPEKQCPECGSDKIEMKMGEVSCRKCGLVIDENRAM